MWHQVVESLAVGTDALANGPCQSFIGVRIAIGPHAFDEGQVQVIDRTRARVKQIAAGDGRDARAPLLHAQAAAPVTIHAGGRRALDLHALFPLRLHRFSRGQYAIAVNPLPRLVALSTANADEAQMRMSVEASSALAMVVRLTSTREAAGTRAADHPAYQTVDPPPGPIGGRAHQCHRYMTHLVTPDRYRKPAGRRDSHPMCQCSAATRDLLQSAGVLGEAPRVSASGSIEMDMRCTCRASAPSLR